MASHGRLLVEVKTLPYDRQYQIISWKPQNTNLPPSQSQEVWKLCHMIDNVSICLTCKTENQKHQLCATKIYYLPCHLQYMHKEQYLQNMHKEHTELNKNSTTYSWQPIVLCHCTKVCTLTCLHHVPKHSVNTKVFSDPRNRSNCATV